MWNIKPKWGYLFPMIRLGLGLAFVTAAWPKIQDPSAFAKIIYGYDLLPGALINLLAIWLPWIEMGAGLLLILGIWAPSALFIVNGLLLVFMAMISFNLARGHSFDCGCFSVTGGGQTSDAVWLLIRDAFMLGPGLFLARFYGRKSISSEPI
ncbi:MAG: DoxX family membrane protein [Desulfobacterales bacterium]|nr:DoxX family membrane protein [Desulfobacterales bacterium]